MIHGFFKKKKLKEIQIKLVSSDIFIYVQIWFNVILEHESLIWDHNSSVYIHKTQNYINFYSDSFILKI